MCLIPILSRHNAKFSFLRRLLSISIVATVLSALCWGQANVNEAAETVSIYVDITKGSDTNSGSQSAPLKSMTAAVTKALNNNDSGIGSRVIVSPGIYRESLTVRSSKNSTSLPITFQAASNGSVIVSGAEIITGWSEYSENSGMYQASWPYSFSACSPQPKPAPTQQSIVLRREMLVVNGTPLSQVPTLASMQRGTFYIDNVHAEIYAYPPSGVNMSTATVETAVQPSLLLVSGQTNLVFRGMTFEYANSCRQSAAVTVTGSSNILFDADNFLWNNSMGIHFANTTNFTVENSVANYNGQVGFGSHQVKSSLWQSNTADNNNWRGAQGAFYGWDTGGGKWMWDHNGTYKSMATNFNQAIGAYWDTDNQSVMYSAGVSAENLLNAMQIEKTEGPFAVSNSNLCFSNLLGIGQTGGVALRNSEQVSLTHTALYSNLVNQSVVIGQAGGIEIKNWETGQSYNLVTEKFNASGNELAGPDAAVFSDSYLGGSDWTAFIDSLQSNNNVFYGGSDTKAFVVPVPKDGTALTLASWQSETGQDTSSSWRPVSEPSACSVEAQSEDFWLTSRSFAGVTMSNNQASINVQTIGLGGISGTVTLTMDGISEVEGLNGTFSVPSIGVNGTSTLRLSATSATPAGTYPITILGTLGSITRTVTISLIVP